MKKIANYLHAWLNNYASMTPTGMIPIQRWLKLRGMS